VIVMMVLGTTTTAYGTRTESTTTQQKQQQESTRRTRKRRGAPAALLRALPTAALPRTPFGHAPPRCFFAARGGDGNALQLARAACAQR
jgi:hypothetical protein